jgi:molybdopterin-guanine dinucleotide biosynthesis protein B
MNVVHLVGRRNHGKTTLLVELVRELRGRGVRLGTIKHSSHSHELDTPGKDSHRHRQAGAAPTAIICANLTAVFVPAAGGDPYALLAPLYAQTDLVFVEGHLDGPGRKLEIWRAELGTSPLCRERADIEALITDDPVEVSVPIWPRADIGVLADRLVALHR